MAASKEMHQLQGSILCIMQAEHDLFCIDNTLYISHIDSNLKLAKRFPISKNIDLPHRYSHAYSASLHRIFAIPIVGDNKVFILQQNGDSMKTIAILNDHESDIESTSFSNDGELFATGGQDGRVFVYSGESLLPITSLMARSDYISKIRFSKNQEYVAISGFDKFTMIFDLLRNKAIYHFSTPDVVEDSCFFANDEKLYLVCRNYASIIFSLHEGKIISHENPFAYWPSCVAIDYEENYALIGTRSDTLYVISLKDNSKAMEIKNEHAGIATLLFSHEYLYMGCVDGMLLIIDYNEGKEELAKSLRDEDFKRAREVIDKNVFLSIHPLTKAFDEAWPKILRQAVQHLNCDEIDEALEITAPFVVNKTKKNEFDFYLAQKEGVKEFLDCVEKKEYHKAYELATTNKFLVKTPAYEKLENIWNKIFSNAKKLLTESALKNKPIVEQYLKPFMNTPKKEVASQLLRNCDVFVRADKFIKDRNFKEYFSLTFKFSFLRDTDLHKKVLLLGEKMLANLIECEKNSQYNEAKQIAELLLVFPPLKRSAHERIIIIQQKEDLLRAIEKDEIKKIYTLVSDNENLRSMSQFKAYTKKFLNLFEEAKEYAYAGNVKHSKVIFGEYMEIAYWISKIASLMKIAYLQQIQHALSQGDVNWEMTIKRYVERYGKDFEFVKKFEDHQEGRAIIDAIEGDGDPEGYRHFSFVDEVVIYFVQRTLDEEH